MRFTRTLPFVLTLGLLGAACGRQSITEPAVQPPGASARDTGPGMLDSGGYTASDSTTTAPPFDATTQDGPGMLGSGGG